MPYQIRKIRGKELFSVKNIETGKIHSHATTKANARKQVKLLQAIDHGFVPSKEHLEGAGFGETLINLYNRIRGIRRDTVAPAPPIQENLNPVGPNTPVNINGNQVAPEPTMSAEDFFRQTGGARLNPAVQTMLNYLKSLYPHKTLMSVANEILKLTGHTMSGKGRKPVKATEIAKYVIGAIGAALAIALALFLLNNKEEEDYEYPEDSLIVYAKKRKAEEKIKIDEANKKREEEYNKRLEEERQKRIKIQGGTRLSSAAKTMITYLKSLYPHKTLVSVANEILKLTGHKMTGKGRKPIKATEIAMYVIKALGTVVAIAVAIFLLSDEDKGISQSNIHPSLLNKPDPEQIDRYPYTPSYTPTTTSSSQKPDISLESLYGDVSPSYTNMMNPGFKKVGIPKKKSGDKYSEYPRSSETFSGNPRGYGRKRRSSAADAKGIRLKKKKKVM